MGYISVPNQGIKTGSLPDPVQRAPQAPPRISSGAQRSYYGGQTTNMEFGSVGNAIVNNLRRNGRSGLGRASNELGKHLKGLTPITPDSPDTSVLSVRPKGSALDDRYRAAVSPVQAAIGAGSPSRGALGPGNTYNGPNTFNVDSSGSVRPGQTVGAPDSHTTSGMLFAQGTSGWKPPVQIPQTVGGPRIAEPPNKLNRPGAIDTTEGQGVPRYRSRATSPFKAMPNPTMGTAPQANPFPGAKGPGGVIDATSTNRPRTPQGQASHDARARALWDSPT